MIHFPEGEFDAIGRSNVTYTTFGHSCGVIPNELPSKSVSRGGSIGGNICWSVRKTGVPSLHMHWEPLFNDRVIFWKTSEVILKTLARWLATPFVCAGFEAMQGTGAAGVLGCARPCVAIRTFYLLLVAVLAAGMPAAVTAGSKKMARPRSAHEPIPRALTR